VTRRARASSYCTTIAVDLAKSVFELAVSKRPGKVEISPDVTFPGVVKRRN
jgi:hypothetical protein